MRKRHKSTAKPSRISTFGLVSSRKPATILVFGPRGSGKSKLLRSSAFGEDVKTETPFEGFSCETVDMDALRATIISWDSDDGVRPACVKRKKKTGIVYVFNASSRREIEKARGQLIDFLSASCCSDDMPLLIVANKKQGEQAVMNAPEVNSFFGLTKRKGACMCLFTDDSNRRAKFALGLQWILSKI